MPTDMEIKCFMEVARTLNFTEAAKNLYLSQQAISRYVKSLEESMGVTLFKRSTRRVEITPEGELFYNLFRNFYSRYEETLIQAKKNQNTRKTTFKIGIMNATNVSFFLDGVAAFERKHPNVEVSWYYDDLLRLIELVDDKTVDVALMFQLFDDRNVKKTDSECVRIIHPSVVMSKIIMPDPNAFGFERLKDIPFGAFVHYRENEEISKESARRIMESLMLPETEILLFNNLEDYYAAIEIGKCYGITNEMVNLFHLPGVNTIPLKGKMKIMCIWKSGARTPLTDDFITALKERL